MNGPDEPEMRPVSEKTKTSIAALRDVAMNGVGASLGPLMEHDDTRYVDEGNFSWCIFETTDGQRFELQVRRMERR